LSCGDSDCREYSASDRRVVPGGHIGICVSKLAASQPRRRFAVDPPNVHPPGAAPERTFDAGTQHEWIDTTPRPKRTTGFARFQIEDVVQPAIVPRWCATRAGGTARENILIDRRNQPGNMERRIERYSVEHHASTFDTRSPDKQRVCRSCDREARCF